MPNWCCSRVCFKGRNENIKRLQNDIELANEYAHRNPMFCNIRYFLSLNGFDIVSYKERFDRYEDTNFRGNIYSTVLAPEEYGEYSLYYPYLETAWWMDNGLLQIISLIYDVKYSCFSEEPGMGIYTKCRNSELDVYDYDYCIRPDAEQLEEAVDNDPQFEMDYIIPVKIGEPDTDEVLDLLKERNIDFEIEKIDEETPRDPYGVYYHYTIGVTYDKEPNWRDYPELDPFNIYINQ